MLAHIPDPITGNVRSTLIEVTSIFIDVSARKHADDTDHSCLAVAYVLNLFMSVTRIRSTRGVIACRQADQQCNI